MNKLDDIMGEILINSSSEYIENFKRSNEQIIVKNDNLIIRNGYPGGKYMTGLERLYNAEGKRYKDFVFNNIETNTYLDVLESIKKRSGGFCLLDDTTIGSYIYWGKEKYNIISTGYKQNFSYEKMVNIKNYNKITQSNTMKKINNFFVAKPYMGFAKNVTEFDMSKKVNSYEKYKNIKITNENIDKINIRRYKMTFRSIKTFNERENLHRIIYRSGVIPYYKYENKIYYGFSLDATHLINPLDNNYGKIDLSDFSGGVDPGESAAQTAIREWFEESYGLFPKYHISKNTLVSYYLGVASFFVNVTGDFDFMNEQIKMNDFIKNNLPTPYEEGDKKEDYEFLKFDRRLYPWKLYEDVKIKFIEELKNYRNYKTDHIPETSGLVWITKEEILKFMKQDHDILNKNIYWILFPNLSIINKIEIFLKNLDNKNIPFKNFKYNQKSDILQNHWRNKTKNNTYVSGIKYT